MGGAYSMWGAIIAAFLLKFLQALLNDWGISPDWLTILFGIGVLQVLTTAPGRTRRPVAQGHGAAGPPDRRPVPPAPPPRSADRMIEVSGLTVRFGGVTPLDGMDVRFEAGTCGLIGPNGAGKTTFFNVLSGFVRPAAGSDPGLWRGPAEDGPLPARPLGRAANLPDRAGDRELSIYDNVAMVHEQSTLSGGSRREEMLEAIEFVGIGADPYAKVVTLAPPSAAWSRSPAPSSASRAWCCSTSRQPVFPRTRPSAWRA